MSPKLMITVFALTAAVVGTSFATHEEGTSKEDVEEIKKYLEMFDKMDIDQIRNNNRLVSSNVKCFLNEGPCTAQLKEIKKMVPKLIKDGCSSCTKEQKQKMKKAIDSMKADRPNDYEKLSKFFDPDGTHEKKFLETLEANSE